MRREEFKILLDSIRGHERFGKRHSDGSPDTHLFDDLHRPFAVPVHIGKEHRPRLDHFQYRKTAANFDIVTGELRFEGPDVLIEPAAQFHIVRITAQERHRRMRMAVVKSGQNGKGGTVHDFGIFNILRGKITAYLGKAPPINQDILLLYFRIFTRQICRF